MRASGPSSDVPPATKSPAVFVEELKSLIATNVAGNMKLLSRVGALIGNAQVAAMREPTRMPNPATAVTRALEFTLNSYAIVNTHALGALNDLVTELERTIAVPSSARAASTTAPSTAANVLRVEGHRGDRVTASFVVDNQYDSPVQVSFHVDALTPSVGAPVSASHVTLEPARLTLAPKAEAVVEAAVNLTDAFVVGETYTTQISTIGFQAPDVELHVAVLPTPAGSSARPSGETSAKRADTKRKRSSS